MWIFKQIYSVKIADEPRFKYASRVNTTYTSELVLVFTYMDLYITCIMSLFYSIIHYSNKLVIHISMHNRFESVWAENMCFNTKIKSRVQC